MPAYRPENVVWTTSKTQFYHCQNYWSNTKQRCAVVTEIAFREEPGFRYLEGVCQVLAGWPSSKAQVLCCSDGIFDINLLFLMRNGCCV